MFIHAGGQVLSHSSSTLAGHLRLRDHMNKPLHKMQLVVYTKLGKEMGSLTSTKSFFTLLKLFKQPEVPGNFGCHSGFTGLKLRAKCIEEEQS